MLPIFSIWHTKHGGGLQYPSSSEGTTALVLRPASSTAAGLIPELSFRDAHGLGACKAKQGKLKLGKLKYIMSHMKMPNSASLMTVC